MGAAAPAAGGGFVPAAPRRAPGARASCRCSGAILVLVQREIYLVCTNKSRSQMWIGPGRRRARPRLQQTLGAPMPPQPNQCRRQKVPLRGPSPRLAANQGKGRGRAFRPHAVDGGERGGGCNRQSGRSARVSNVGAPRSPPAADMGGACGGAGAAGPRARGLQPQDAATGGSGAKCKGGR
ncbi:MAG: hypothetical protein J3K34DRAFT_430708 [Monoraphidium minutum]|nr:MAG: hypothetical protein J3K34DRAFT_430708 [Monoraphidium minutum]